MGQRFQSFLSVFNPINSFEVEGETEKEKSIKRLERTSKYNEEFGIGKTTVLAFHHQWLYGVSATANVCQILNFIKYGNESHNPFLEAYWKNQYRHRTTEDALKFLVDSATNIQNIATSPLYKEVGRIGIERFLYLNKEDSNMRTHWNNGDNNDGCTIVDATTGKYCFIVDFKLRGLKKHIPYSAEQYAAAYYPNTEKSLKKYYKEQEDESKIGSEEFKDELKHNKKLVKLVKKSLGEYEVLTLDEVKAIFPKVEYAEPKIKKSK